MGRQGFSPEQIESARQRAADGIYEDRRHCTHVSVDDVSVRKQKAHCWSKVGSHALTALSVLVCNRCQAIWVREQTIPLRFVDKKAA